MCKPPAATLVAVRPAPSRPGPPTPAPRRHRSRSVLRIPQPAERAVTPAPHTAVVEHRDRCARSPPTPTPRCDPAPTSTGPTDPGASSSPTLSVLPYPNRPDRARAPAPHRAVVQHRARVEATGRDRRGRATRPQIHRAHRPRGLVVTDVVRVPVPQLAASRPSPNTAPCRRPTPRTCGSRRRRSRSPCAPLPDPPGPPTPGSRRHRSLSVLPYPNRPDAARAPTPHGAVVQHRARVGAAGGDLRSRCGPPPDRPGPPPPRSRRHRWCRCCRTPTGRRPEPQHRTVPSATNAHVWSVRRR